MVDTRCDDQIIIDALRAERDRLSKRLNKMSTENDASAHLQGLIDARKAAANLDFNAPDAMDVLARLANQERESLEAMERLQNRDYMSDLDTEISLKVEVDSIDRLLAKLTFKLAKRNQSHDMD